MKKVFIVDNWFGDLGGRKKAILSLINDIDDFEIILLTLDTKISKNKIEGFHKDLKKEIKIYPYFISHGPFLLPQVFLKFGFFLKKIKPDIVISIGGGPHSNAFFSLISKIFLPKTPTIIVNHQPPSPFLKKQNFVLRYLTKLIYQKVEKNISVSQGLMESIKQNFKLKDNQCSFIYNGFDLNNILKKAHEPVSHTWFQENIPIVITAGRLDEFSKDFPTLFHALAKVKSQGRKIRLIILGDGPQKEYLEQLTAKLNIKEDIWFAGFQENPYKFIAKADLFVLSSKFESFALVLVEAMTCGAPVISSDCNFGPREILENGKCGILVPPGNFQAMANAIEGLLDNDSLCKQLINNGRVRASEFKNEKMIKKYIKIFREVLKQ